MFKLTRTLALATLLLFGSGLMIEVLAAPQKRSRSTQQKRSAQKRSAPSSPSKSSSDDKKSTSAPQSKPTAPSRTRSTGPSHQSSQTPSRQDKSTTPSSSPSVDPRSRSRSDSPAERTRPAIPSRDGRETTRPDSPARPDPADRSDSVKRDSDYRSRITAGRTRPSYQPDGPSTRGAEPSDRSRSPITGEYRRSALPKVTPNPAVAPSNRGEARSFSAKLYERKAVSRSRGGSFNDRSNGRAVADRELTNHIRMRDFDSGNGRRYSGASHSDTRSYSYARRDYIDSGFRLVDRRSDGAYVVNRYYLINYDGRYGYCNTRYTGRNFHFYLTLVNDHFYFGAGYSSWKRRCYGDGWDSYFGWNAGIYIPAGYQSYGAYYFEPCYAFSFTFNHGYEQGYIDGYNQGVSDWNNYYSYNSYPTGVSGYQSWLGPYYEYTDGYDQGFRQGYYAGYSGLQYGYANFGFGDFSQYPVVYDFDYDHFDNVAYYDGYEYTDGYNSQY